MDKNNLIGMALIFVCLMAYMQLNQPTPEQLAEEERLRDSIALVEQTNVNITQEGSNSTENTSTPIAELSDTLLQMELSKKYGYFAAAGSGTEENPVLENDLVKITFSSKGGKIKEVLLKEYFTLLPDTSGQNIQAALKLMEDQKDRFDYIFPIQGTG